MKRNVTYYAVIEYETQDVIYEGTSAIEMALYVSRNTAFIRSRSKRDVIIVTDIMQQRLAGIMKEIMDAKIDELFNGKR